MSISPKRPLRQPRNALKRPPPFDVEAERALQRRWAEINAEPDPRKRDWHDTWLHAARVAYERARPSDYDDNGFPGGWDDWPETRRMAWFAGWSDGFYWRLRLDAARERPCGKGE
jgi:hypothetical protein